MNDDPLDPNYTEVVDQRSLEKKRARRIRRRIRERVRTSKALLRGQLRQYREQMRLDAVQMSLYVLRLVLAATVFLALLANNRELSLVLFAVSLAVGFVDYFLYRRVKVYTHVESVLNASADKLLVNLSAIALYAQGEFPLWALTIFLVKDGAFILAGLRALVRNKFTIFKQTAMSKVTVFFQTVSLSAVLIDKADTVLLITASGLALLTIGVAVFRPEFRLARRDEFRLFAYRRLLKPADFVTLFNVFLGFVTMIVAMNGHLFIACGVLLICVFFDFLDGKIARLTRTANEFGKQLDSLADTISFGVAPTVIGFTVVSTKLALLAFTVFLFCGVLRLAKFNTIPAQGYYLGMPITWNGIVIPLAIFAGLPTAYLPYLYILLAILMVSPVQIKKAF